MIRFPEVPQDGPRLGVGFDLCWGKGFVAHPSADRVAPGPPAFLKRHADVFEHVFVSWQPRSRRVPAIEDYVDAWDALFRPLEGYPVRALHQTTLNLGAPAGYDRSEILALTAALCDRYDLRWVNEDLGLWSLDGRPLPYPLPPFLTDAGLAACIRNVHEVQDGLPVPLLVEFPGFSDGWSLCVGDWDAYDHFREVVRQTGSACTLDVGHLLSWRWFRGHRGEALFADLDRLPLEHCFEIHLAGVRLQEDRFVDAHHGVLVDAQLRLLETLLGLCPNLRAVTFEDPVFDERGELDPSNRDSLRALQAICGRSIPVASMPQPDPVPVDPTGTVAGLERGLDAVLRDPSLLDQAPEPIATLPAAEVTALSQQLRDSVAGRRALGVKPLRETFRRVVDAWPGDEAALWDAFQAHPAAASWGELGCGLRPCLEEAFYRFALELDLVDPTELRDALYSALIVALSVDPEPAFRVPPEVRGGPGRWRIVDPGPPCRIYATVGPKILRGDLPPLAARILSGEIVGPEPVRTRLVALGLLPGTPVA